MVGEHYLIETTDLELWSGYGQVVVLIDNSTTDIFTVCRFNDHQSTNQHLLNTQTLRTLTCCWTVGSLTLGLQNQ